jgi:hypothetical protein
MIDNLIRYSKNLVWIFSLLILSNAIFGQEESKKDTTKSADLVTPTDTTKAKVTQTDTTKAKVTRRDTTKAQVNYNPADSTKFAKDTIQDMHNDVSALDIGTSRGIFILSSDGMLQLRILGSVRANFNYSDQDLVDYQTFNPFYVPTDINTVSPNFFAGIKQTRLGFEVTRRTKELGDIFIRIEADFNSSSGTFRVRHAYGQVKGFLVGQTWSLMNNVSYQPAMVSNSGPVGGSSVRTPQVRYSRSFDNKKKMWSAAIEYSSPSLNLPDSIDAEILQVIPDLTGKYSYQADLISFSLSGVVSTISGRLDDGDIGYFFGLGVSFAGKLKIKDKGQLFLLFNTGRAVSHFYDVFSGNNQDMAFNTNSGQIEALFANSGSIAYSQTLPKNFSTSLGFGIASISNSDIQAGDAYSYSYNALINLFWEPLDGSRLGIEYAFGQRIDNDNSGGFGNRLSILMYYDF